MSSVASGADGLPEALAHANRQAPTGPSARWAAREVGAGATAGCLALPFCVSSGVLAYEPLGPRYVGFGAAAGILCAVAGGLAGSLARTSSFIPNMPSASMALIQASFAASLMTAFGGDLGKTLVILPLSVILAGLWQALIGLSGLARIVKFTPYPVLAGFLTGIAVLTLVQQLPRLFGVPAFGDLVESILHWTFAAPAMPIFGLALVAFMRVSERLAPKIPAMLVGLVAGTLLYHASRLVFPGMELGSTIGSVSLADASSGFRFDATALQALAASPELLKALVLTSLTLAVLGTLDLTFALRAAQKLDDIEMAPRRNLAGQGVANVLAALASAMPITTSISFSNTIFGAGGRTRLSTAAMALTLLVAALLAPRLIATLPRLVLAAILVSIGLRMWDRWCITLVHDMLAARERDARVRARRNAGIVFAVTLATVFAQPVAGALVGVVLSCLVFIMEMSRPIVRRRLDGSQIFSKRIRSQHDQAILAASGCRTVLLDLQGVLFFGNADDLASEVKSLEGAADIVILELKRVTDLDTSGATVLHQIAVRCRAQGLRLLVAGADGKYERLVHEALEDETDPAIFFDLDGALEYAEDRTLAAHAARRPTWSALRIDQTDLGGGLSERDLALLTDLLTPCSYAAGEVLCTAGEPADRLWLISRGAVSIRLSGAHFHRRIAGLGPGTSVGEMGLLDRRPRSADVVADEAVDAYVLTAENFDRLMRDEPKLGQSLLATIARLTSQRLRATSEELRLAEA